MKRMAIMRQKKIILNDFIRIEKKKILMEQEKQEEAQRRIDMLPIIKMIEAQKVETQRDDENILAMVESKEN